MSTQLDRVSDALHARGCKIKWKSGRKGFEAQCPAHEDKNPSLSVDQKGDKVVFNCHAGCSQQAVIDAAGLSWGDLFNDNGNGSKVARAKPGVVETYDYCDEDGNVLFQVVRREDKSFPQRKPDGNGGWTWGTEGVRRVLYNLPTVLDVCSNGGTVYILEGEKDADAINATDPDRTDYCATCNPMGAGKWTDDYADALVGASRVVVWRDKDDPGRKHAQQVAHSVRGAVTRVEVVEAKEGKDASDHLAAGLGLNDAVVVEGSEQFDPSSVELDLLAMLDATPEPPPWSIPNWLVEGSVTLIGGEDKAGKSTIAASIALALVSGQPWLGEIDVECEPSDVVYIDEENPENLLAHRLPRILRGLKIPREAIPRLHYISRKGFHFDEPEGYERMMRYLRAIRPNWVFIDTLSQFHSRDEKQNTQMARLYREKIQPIQKELKCGIVVLHHLSKPSKDRQGDSYRIRGATAIPGWCDEKLLLTRVEGSPATLTRERGRWGGKHDPLSIDMIEGVDANCFDVKTSDDDDSRVLVLLKDRGKAGALRTKIRSDVLDGDDKRTTRVLGRLYAKKRVAKSGNRSAMTYYLPEYAPYGAEEAA